MSYEPYKEYIKEFKSNIRHFFIVVKRLCKNDLGEENIELIQSIEEIINKAIKLSDVYIDKIVNDNNIDLYSNYNLFNKVILSIFLSLKKECNSTTKIENLIFVSDRVKELISDIGENIKVCNTNDPDKKVLVEFMKKRCTLILSDAPPIQPEEYKCIDIDIDVMKQKTKQFFSALERFCNNEGVDYSDYLQYSDTIFEELNGIYRYEIDTMYNSNNYKYKDRSSLLEDIVSNTIATSTKSYALVEITKVLSWISDKSKELLSIIKTNPKSDDTDIQELTEFIKEGNVLKSKETAKSIDNNEKIEKLIQNLKATTRKILSLVIESVKKEIVVCESKLDYYDSILNNSFNAMCKFIDTKIDNCKDKYVISLQDMNNSIYDIIKALIEEAIDISIYVGNHFISIDWDVWTDNEAYVFGKGLKPALKENLKKLEQEFFLKAENTSNVLGNLIGSKFINITENIEYILKVININGDDNIVLMSNDIDNLSISILSEATKEGYTLALEYLLNNAYCKIINI